MRGASAGVGLGFLVLHPLDEAGVAGSVPVGSSIGAADDDGATVVDEPLVVLVVDVAVQDVAAGAEQGEVAAFGGGGGRGR